MSNAPGLDHPSSPAAFSLIVCAITSWMLDGNQPPASAELKGGIAGLKLALPIASDRGLVPSTFFRE
jgi:hypothetical protein